MSNQPCECSCCSCVPFWMLRCIYSSTSLCMRCTDDNQCCHSWIVHPHPASPLPSACAVIRLEIYRFVICLVSLVSRPLPEVFDGLGDLLMPAVTPQSTGGSTAGSMGTPVAGGGIAAAPPATPPPTKTIGGDLDSSLANLVGGTADGSFSLLYIPVPDEDLKLTCSCFFFLHLRSWSKEKVSVHFNMWLV